MSLNTYTDDARADITDENHLRDVLDELQTLLTDIVTRIERLENA